MDKPTLDPEDRHALVSNINLLFMLLVLAGVVVRWYALGRTSLPWPGIVFLLIFLGNAVYLSRLGSSDIAAGVLISTLTVALFVSGYNTGGFAGPIPIISPLIPIAAFLLLSLRAGFLSLMVVSLILLVLLTLHLSAKIPDNLSAETNLMVVRYVAVTLTVLITGLVASAFVNSHRKLLSKVGLSAHTDYLTGIANRRSVSLEFAKETARARRNGSWISTLMIDVDHFKRFNDINGHAEGDECLKRVANVLKNAVARPADLLGRYGGEEFIVVLIETDPLGAAKVAETLRAEVQAQNIPYEDGKSAVVTVSIGSFSSSDSGTQREDVLIKHADLALYKAKKAGRNRVVAQLPEG
ncbi:diguanylate cyclase (GGDEF domain) [marine gamma proteobacterium HTCC2143]|jgi:diguanylate cyclase (GGDEF)-like protein|uniref:diguanylate cyclase n=1 Tax=marine gamma proteobacterium HTCC2143 TaxID=247633 RepID=A0YFQ5_9GAMM|nr:diguanylate cyclase (GGDEF domain) [marine gamma proteobacterium HTCC2143]